MSTPRIETNTSQPQRRLDEVGSMIERLALTDTESVTSKGSSQITDKLNTTALPSTFKLTSNSTYKFQQRYNSSSARNLRRRERNFHNQQNRRVCMDGKCDDDNNDGSVEDGREKELCLNYKSSMHQCFTFTPPIKSFKHISVKQLNSTARNLFGRVTNEDTSVKKSVTKTNEIEYATSNTATSTTLSMIPKSSLITTSYMMEKKFFLRPQKRQKGGFWQYHELSLSIQDDYTKILKDLIQQQEQQLERHRQHDDQRSVRFF